MHRSSIVCLALSLVSNNFADSSKDPAHSSEHSNVSRDATKTWFCKQEDRTDCYSIDTRLGITDPGDCFDLTHTGWIQEIKSVKPAAGVHCELSTVKDCYAIGQTRGGADGGAGWGGGPREVQYIDGPDGDTLNPALKGPFTSFRCMTQWAKGPVNVHALSGSELHEDGARDEFDTSDLELREKAARDVVADIVCLLDVTAGQGKSCDDLRIGHVACDAKRSALLICDEDSKKWKVKQRCGGTAQGWSGKHACKNCACT